MENTQSTSPAIEPVSASTKTPLLKRPISFTASMFLLVILGGAGVAYAAYRINKFTTDNDLAWHAIINENRYQADVASRAHKTNVSTAPQATDIQADHMNEAPKIIRVNDTKKGI